jgi:hypothetical protein
LLQVTGTGAFLWPMQQPLVGRVPAEAAACCLLLQVTGTGALRWPTQQPLVGRVPAEAAPLYLLYVVAGGRYRVSFDAACHLLLLQDQPQAAADSFSVCFANHGMLSIRP